MDSSGLNKLPGELRNRIYRYALVQTQSITFDARAAFHLFHVEDQPGVADALALLATCKQIRDEALPIFFAENQFDIKTGIIELYDPDESDVVEATYLTRMIIGGWLLMIGTSARHIKHVKFYIGGWAASIELEEDRDRPPIMLTRIMKDLRALLNSTAATPEGCLEIDWADSGRGPKDKFDSPMTFLTFSDGNTIRKAITQALQDEDALVERSLPGPGESSFGLVEAWERRAGMQQTRKNIELVATMLETELGS